MKSSSEEKARLRTLLSDAISLLCKNSLGLIDLQFSIEALIGISVNNEDVMVLSFKETVLPDGAAISYVWQKDSGGSRCVEVDENDVNINNALSNVDTDSNEQKFKTDQSDLMNFSEENRDASDLRLKVEGESLPYEEFQNNFTSSGTSVYDSNPYLTIPASSTVNKRRKQSVPVKVYNEQLDCDEGDIKFETRNKLDTSISRKLLSDSEYVHCPNLSSSARATGQVFDSILNGESRFLLERTKHSVPSRQSVHKVLNVQKNSRRSNVHKGDNGGLIGKVLSNDFTNDLSPNCSITMNEQDLYSNQPENYTYQALNSTHYSANNNNKRRKQVSSSSAKNFNEQDSQLISELLPYLSDQHRPMLIPPTVTQFAPKKRCRVCYSKKIRKEVRYCCYGCSDHPGLCLDPCFYQFHLVRGSAYPKPTESLGYSQEVPTEDECPQNIEECSSWNDTNVEMT